jgi:hypothetical protein
MLDELDILKLVAARLGEAGIPYMVSGSMAMNYYAQPRMTRDVDIVIELGAADVERVAALFIPDFLCEVEAVRDAVRRRGMFNIIHGESVVKVDFIVRKDVPFRVEEFDPTPVRGCRADVAVDGQPGGSAAVETPLGEGQPFGAPVEGRAKSDRLRGRPRLGIHRKLGEGSLGVRSARRSALMNDTPATVENLQREMLMRRSGAERLRMGAAMFEAARRIIRASLGDPDGRDHSADMRVKVFLRVYGSDFDPATRERIVAWLRAFPPAR